MQWPVIPSGEQGAPWKRTLFILRNQYVDHTGADTPPRTTIASTGSTSSTFPSRTSQPPDQWFLDLRQPPLVKWKRW